MRPFIVTEPVGDVVLPADFLTHIRGNAEDSAVAAQYLNAAVAHLDGYSGRLGRCILSQKWAFPLWDSPEIIFLPFPDCRELKFERQDENGDWSDVIGATFEIAGRDEYRLLNLPDDVSGLALTCVAGWESAADVPDSLKQAIQMLAGHWYENRVAVDGGEANSPVALGFEAMIGPFKNVFV